MANELSDADRAVIANANLFTGVAPALMASTLEHCSIRHLNSGDTLLCPDALNQYIYLVLTGSLHVHVGDVKQEPLAKIGVGEVVGEMSVLDNQKPSASVVAGEQTRILELHQTAVWRIVDDTEGMARNLLYILSNRLRFNTSALLESMRRQILFENVANLDPLTDLHNRRWLDRTLTRLIEDDNAGTEPFSLILADIDFFKRFNDSYGHPAGDVALRQVAIMLADGLRPSDSAARYGGEEFAVILPNTRLEAATAIADRLCQSVRQTSLKANDGHLLPPVTISLGVAEHQPQQSKDELITAADQALYRAKNQGRDRSCC